MASFNKIIIVGNLGRDPEMRYMPSGDPVCEFSVATNERRRDNSGETVDMVTWFRISIFGKRGEIANQYLSKGKPVFISGRLRQEEYTDREGVRRTSLRVVADDFQFIGSRGDEGPPSAPPSSRASSNDPGPPPSGPADDDIPF